MAKQKRLIGTCGRLFIITALILGMASSVWCAQSDYNGTYAGTYIGDDNGYWVAIVDEIYETDFLSYSTTKDSDDVGIMNWGGESGGVGNYSTKLPRYKAVW